LLNKASVSQLAELSKLSKSYISQVKSGKRPASQRLIKALATLQSSGKRASETQNAIDLFIKSRREGISPNTIRDYRNSLSKAIGILGLTPKTADINGFLSALSCSLGGKYCYFKCIRAFYNWLYSPISGFDFLPENNPVTWAEAPKRPVLILPSLTRQQVQSLIDRVGNVRDKAIIALFTESGLRLSELTNVEPQDIDWQNRIIKTLGKGNKEGYAPFGSLSEHYLKAWLAQYQPNGGNIWGLNAWGIISMLKRLQKETGLPCNPHTFRRTFACLLRKAGVDSMTVKDLGRWESLEMVQRYTRSVTFHDSLKFYKPPLS